MDRKFIKIKICECHRAYAKIYQMRRARLKRLLEATGLYPDLVESIISKFGVIGEDWPQKNMSRALYHMARIFDRAGDYKSIISHIKKDRSKHMSGFHRYYTELALYPNEFHEDWSQTLLMYQLHLELMSWFDQ